MATDINLPRSSILEIIKIIKGYSLSGDQIKIDDLAKNVAIGAGITSANNKFLTQMNLISGGNTKSVTKLGKKLGRALVHDQEADAKACWHEANTKSPPRNRPLSI